MSLSMEQVAALVLDIIVKREGGSRQNLDGDALARASRATSIVWAESRGNPTIRNTQPVGGGCSGPGSRHATGLFQIVPACHPRYPDEQLTDAAGNAGAAYDISNGYRDWGPWEASPATYAEEAKRAVATVAGLDQSSVERLLRDIPLVGGAAGDAFAIGADAAGAVVDPLQQLLSVFEFYSNPRNYLRALYVTGGMVLAVTGVAMIAIELAGPELIGKSDPAPNLGTVAGSPTTP